MGSRARSSLVSTPRMHTIWRCEAFSLRERLDTVPFLLGARQNNREPSWDCDFRIRSASQRA